MATQTDFLLAGVDADQFLVGPAVILLQGTTNYDTSADAAAGMPRYIDDVVNVTTGAALTANGWTALGYTENIAQGRNRTTVLHDSDQEAQVKNVHDTWENTITVTALETSLTNIATFWQARSSDPSAVAGAPTGQQWVRVGNPLDISYRRIAIVQVDDSGFLWVYVWRKCHLRPTGGPTFTRTGRVEWPLEMQCFSDTRISDVDDRVVRVFRTNASV
jgi:hypothetical protein